MRTRPLLHTLLAIAATSLVFGCADDEQPPTGDDEVGDGDGDGDGQDEVGDGDGEPPGDGDGEPGDGDGEPGDGDGEPGDGDGEPGDGDGEPGDGDGEPGDGDGDGEPLDQCQMAATLLAPELAQPEGGCSIVVRFSYETLQPVEWAHTCGLYVDTQLNEEAARMLSECCSDGIQLLEPSEDQPLFVFYSTPEPEGGISAVSSLLGQRSFEATILMEGTGEIRVPEMWLPGEQLGGGCEASPPQSQGFDLNMDGAELNQTELDAVLAAFADTALTQAIEQTGTIRSTVVLAYPRVVPFDPEMTEYVMIIEAGE